MGGKFIDLSGQRFGKLSVMARTPRPGARAFWKCACDCGRETDVPTDRLKSGKTRSCGCLVQHGHSTRESMSPTYSSWRAMIGRCTQPSNPAFAHYRKRGIGVCDRWRAFENFLADMGDRPGREFTIERKDNDRGYEPGNCVWATRLEQGNNRVTNRRFTYQGEEITFAELVRRTGKPKEFLRHRLLRAGWSVEKALNAPHQQGARTDLL